jgi:hypothetical protein
LTTLNSSTCAFSTPPYPIAPDAALSTFRINVPEVDLEELQAHLKLFRVPRSTYENSNLGWQYGMPKDWLVNAVDYWRDEFDWYVALKAQAQYHLISLTLTSTGASKKKCLIACRSSHWPSRMMMESLIQSTLLRSSPLKRTLFP